ncbi:MAG: DoxX family protein [Aestuariivita sp.]|nr:DoxX family protein [Aestuariivita sp.]
MRKLVHVHNCLFGQFVRSSDFLVPTLARLAFAFVLLVYFWNSATTKIDGFNFSPTAGAFGQIFPKDAEAASYDITKLTFIQETIIIVGTLAEFILPALILIGLFTRLAAVGTIGFILVQTFVDVSGHGVTLGTYFDHSIGLIDERTMWLFLMLVLLFKGAGPVSLDRTIKLV